MMKKLICPACLRIRLSPLHWVARLTGMEFVVKRIRALGTMARLSVRVMLHGMLPTLEHLEWALEAERYVLDAGALGYSQEEAAELLHEAVQRGGYMDLALRMMTAGWRPVTGGAGKA